MARSRKARAELVIHQKLTSPKGLVREIRIWQVPKSIRYPEGVRYRLVLADPLTKSTILLYDNHWPKGHHVHRHGQEAPYSFTTVRDLVVEFRAEADKAEKGFDARKED